MSFTLSIDPGLNITGWAVFNDRRLTHAGVARSKYKTLGTIAADMHQQIAKASNRQMFDDVAVELMHVYDLRHQKGDQNDLIHVASVGALLAGLFDPLRVEFYTASEWKGQMPKNVSHNRIEARLQGAEKSVLKSLPTAKTVRHNAMDAIGVGLKHVGRRA